MTSGENGDGSGENGDILERVRRIFGTEIAEAWHGYYIAAAPIELEPSGLFVNNHIQTGDLHGGRSQMDRFIYR
jgi:hypothetical protein